MGESLSFLLPIFIGFLLCHPRRNAFKTHKLGFLEGGGSVFVINGVAFRHKYYKKACAETYFAFASASSYALLETSSKPPIKCLNELQNKGAFLRKCLEYN